MVETITIFVLAIFVGYYVVWGVTPALHTPLMAVTNALSSIIVVGAMLQTVGLPVLGVDANVAFQSVNVVSVLGAIAVFLASINIFGTVAKLAMRQPFVLFKGLTFQKLCLPGAFRPGDHHNKMLRPGLCVVHASPQYL